MKSILHKLKNNNDFSYIINIKTKNNKYITTQYNEDNKKRRNTPGI